MFEEILDVDVVHADAEPVRRRPVNLGGQFSEPRLVLQFLSSDFVVGMPSGTEAPAPSTNIRLQESSGFTSIYSPMGVCEPWPAVAFRAFAASS